MKREFFFASRRERWSCGAVTSDAEFVCVSRASSGGQDLILCNGSFLELDGKTVMNSSRAIERWERVEGEIVQIYSSDPQAAEQPNAAETVS